MKAKSNTEDRFVIIMAGGKGERFWPVSREQTPKQLLALLGNRSFLQQAVDRVLPLVPIKSFPKGKNFSKFYPIPLILRAAARPLSRSALSRPNPPPVTATSGWANRCRLR